MQGIGQRLLAQYDTRRHAREHLPEHVTMVLRRDGNYYNVWLRVRQCTGEIGIRGQTIATRKHIAPLGTEIDTTGESESRMRCEGPRMGRHDTIGRRSEIITH